MELSTILIILLLTASFGLYSVINTNKVLTKKTLKKYKVIVNFPYKPSVFQKTRMKYRELIFQDSAALDFENVGVYLNVCSLTVFDFDKDSFDIKQAEIILLSRVFLVDINGKSIKEVIHDGKIKISGIEGREIETFAVNDDGNDLYIKCWVFIRGNIGYLVKQIVVIEAGSEVSYDKEFFSSFVFYAKATK